MAGRPVKRDPCLTSSACVPLTPRETVACLETVSRIVSFPECEPLGMQPFRLGLASFMVTQVYDSHVAVCDLPALFCHRRNVFHHKVNQLVQPPTLQRTHLVASSLGVASAAVDTGSPACQGAWDRRLVWPRSAACRAGVCVPSRGGAGSLLEPAFSSRRVWSAFSRAWLPSVYVVVSCMFRPVLLILSRVRFPIVDPSEFFVHLG